MLGYTILVIFLTCFMNVINYANSSVTIEEANDNNTTIWGPILEEWTLSNHRQTRVMKLPSSSEGTITVINENEKESKISPGNKIVNMKKPPPGRQVTETDLYLLNAIEKLVYRVDFMEKRLRKVEEMLYYVMAGNRIDDDPCPTDFSRVGPNCYTFKSDAGREMDWKAASKQCQKMGSVLVEMETIEELQDLVAFIQTTPHLKGKDFWTGGLNPGLLWIWSNSARPVPPTKKGGSSQNKPEAILGDGRCLKLSYDPRLRTYAYRGTDCGVRFSYICEITERKSNNQITKLN